MQTSCDRAAPRARAHKRVRIAMRFVDGARAHKRVRIVMRFVDGDVARSCWSSGDFTCERSRKLAQACVFCKRGAARKEVASRKASTPPRAHLPHWVCKWLGGYGVSVLPRRGRMADGHAARPSSSSSASRREPAGGRRRDRGSPSPHAHYGPWQSRRASLPPTIPRMLLCVLPMGRSPTIFTIVEVAVPSRSIKRASMCSPSQQQ